MTEQSTEETRIHSIDELSEKVERILSMLSGSGQQDAGSESEPEEPAADPKAEMRAELAKLQAAEKRKQAREQEKAAGEARLSAIEEKLKEKPPREYKRSTKFMRWQDEDDK